MQRVDGILGNVGADADLSSSVTAHRENGTLERVVIPAGDRHKSRLRVATDAGTDLGIVVEDPPLLAGDVLVLDADRAVVVAFEDEEAVVVDLPEPSPEGVATAVELGHRIGNQHWDLAVRDGAAYIPVAADRHIIENVLSESLSDGIEPRYEMVDASLWVEATPEESHADGHDHAHGGGNAHDHAHGDSHSHDHSHTDEGAHGHTHGDDHPHEHTHAGGRSDDGGEME